MNEKKQTILDDYKKDIERWRERGSQYRDIQPVTTNDVLFMRAVLHPTNKAESKDVTKRLITLLCERKIVTSKEIFEALGLSDKPVMKRLKIFRQFALVRKESNKYYLPTPRMEEVYRRYLRRICE